MSRSLHKLSLLHNSPKHATISSKETSPSESFDSNFQIRRVSNSDFIFLPNGAKSFHKEPKSAFVGQKIAETQFTKNKNED